MVPAIENITRRMILVQRVSEGKTKKMTREGKGTRFYIGVRLGIVQGKISVELTLNKLRTGDQIGSEE